MVLRLPVPPGIHFEPAPWSSAVRGLRSRRAATTAQPRGGRATGACRACGDALTRCVQLWLAAFTRRAVDGGDRHEAVRIRRRYRAALIPYCRASAELEERSSRPR